MCTIAMALTGVSGLMQYKQVDAQTKAQSAAYEAQAAAAEQNAKGEANRQGQIADSYAAEARQMHAHRRLAEGSQRAETGASGIGFSGSALDILSGTVDAYNQDKQTMLTNQRNDNYSSRTVESNYINQANAAKTAASNVKSQGKLAKLGTIIGTATGMYGLHKDWAKAKTADSGFSYTPSWDNPIAMNNNNPFTTGIDLDFQKTYGSGFKYKKKYKW